MNRFSPMYSDAFCAEVARYMNTGRYQHQADAADAVRRDRPELAPRAQRPTATAVEASAASAEAELERRARDLQQREQVTYAVAFSRVLNSDPALYVQYLREHQARLDSATQQR